MLLILPNQLFHKKYLKKFINEDIILYEHPQYFKKYKFNKKKLVLHRASMKYYYDYLKLNKFNVKYIEYNTKLPNNKYIYFDPIDMIKIKGTMIETPNFILNKEQYSKYRNKTTKYLFTNFYLWSKKELDLYPNLKSKDKFNRERYKDNIVIPKLPSNKADKYYIDEAVKYVNKNFPKNYGNTDNFIYPISHKTAKKWLINFLKNKLKNFGPYQDFVKKGENFMFHSILSSSINIGLLNPSEIIKELKKYKSKVNINSFEGYLRQLFWREYQRYTYIYVDWKKLNYFDNKKKLTKKWYNGTLNIPPVDDLIKDGFETGYIHHIGRLMFVGNFMNLSGISPNEGVKWFMEFSIDSYEWVMQQNVRDMVFFVTGGLTMRKPYITSSNYILKMSNYKKGEWSEKWNELYHNFLKKNKKKLWKFRYSFPTLKNI
jgi:deoxyribodipyrimidine photolyase-related protein